MKDLQAIVRALCEGNPAGAALATLVSVEGSSYRRPGARLLVKPDGSRLGSISGGCLEEDVMVRAEKVYATGRPDAVVYDTTSENDLVWGVGLGCHGIVRVLIEKLPPRPAWAAALAENFRRRQTTALAIVHRGGDPSRWGTRLASAASATDVSVDERPSIHSSIRGAAANDETTFLEHIAPPTALAIFGAGDDAQPLARLAKELGWHVTIADPRPAFATADRFPMADRVIVGPAHTLVQKSAPDTVSLAVVMTHHYVHDVPLLRQLLTRPLAYLGLLGPRKRADKILADIEHDGGIITPEQRVRLHAPVGLDIGADGPEQVALSILAEMQAVLTNRDARPLRDRAQPIHQ